MNLRGLLGSLSSLRLHLRTALPPIPAPGWSPLGFYKPLHLGEQTSEAWTVHPCCCLQVG